MWESKTNRKTRQTHASSKHVRNESVPHLDNEKKNVRYLEKKWIYVGYYDLIWLKYSTE